MMKIRVSESACRLDDKTLLHGQCRALVAGSLLVANAPIAMVLDDLHD
jgi:hypothetical protein